MSQPAYIVVYCFRHVFDDFVAEGIYTLQRDADEHLARLKAENPRACAAVVMRTHAELVRELTDARLGALATPWLVRLIRELRNEVATLYSNSVFPVAVAARKRR